ncbi:MAG TPA: S9 family peptidase [Cellvibrionaceae bacterium]
MNRLALLTLLSTIHCSLWAQAPLYPLESFARLPQYSNPQISPDGRKIAATVVVNGKPIIYIKNRDEPTKVYPPISSNEAYFSHYKWANNDRLLVALRGTNKSRNFLFNYLRLVSARFDGTAPIGYKMEPNKYGYFRQHAWFIGQNRTDRTHLLMELDDNPEEWNAPQVHKVDLETGKKELIQKNDMQVERWIADNQGRIRVGIRYKDSNTSFAILYRENERAPWEELQNVKYKAEERLDVVGFSPDDDQTLLVSSDQLRDGESSLSGPSKLFKYNLKTRQIEGEYSDSDYNKVKATAEKAMPGYTIEIISWDDAKKVYTLVAFSDVKTPRYFLYDRNLKTMDLIGSAFPQLENAQLAKMQEISYPARDSYKIPAFLTLPDGVQKNLPFVIFVHGGPWERDHWGFDNYVQFFANRGYGVLQPQFRGSTGHGSSHRDAGLRQWGRLIQDDISDGVKWIISQGLADPKRICIVGGSFGGYAAATGLAKTPELYKCGISVNGVMDLEKLYDDMARFIGKNLNRDLFNDANNLKVDSPFHLAEQIKAPLLLLAATKDTVVPFEHSMAMFKKLEKLKKPVTFVELKNGEHWRSVDQNEAETFKAMEAFLAKELTQ